MLRFSTLLLSGLCATSALLAQTSDVVVFSEMGEKFTLIIDGDVKNAAPATRVVATGLRNETPLIVVKVDLPNIPPVKQNAWMEFGKEYTLKLTTNKKGEYVLRMQGQNALGTAAATEPAKITPSDFHDDAPAGSGSSTQTSGGNVETTTTVTEQTVGGNGDGDNVNMSIGVNGVGLNMNVGVTGMNAAQTTTTTTTTTTHTTTRTSGTTTTNDAVVTKEPEAYHMAGYSGKIGCPWPMSDSDFNSAKSSIGSKDFEESKMTTAKQVCNSKCFTVAQVKEVMGLFSFEQSKLDFAKYAYTHTYDVGNYYQVNDAFGFESSIDDLNQYIQSH